MRLLSSIADLLASLPRAAGRGRGPQPPPGPPSNPSLTLVLADISERDVDAVVNAADWTMLGGTGVDGAIHAKAGRELGRHIVERGLRLDTAQVHATPGFGLKARHILHTCAPTYEGTLADREAGREALELCYRACVERADAMGLDSLSFPLLGSGAFHWPLPQAAELCARALRAAAPRCRSLKLVEVCAFDEAAAAALESALGLVRSESADPALLAYHAGASALEGMTADEISRRF